MPLGLELRPRGMQVQHRLQHVMAAFVRLAGTLTRAYEVGDLLSLLVDR